MGPIEQTIIKQALRAGQPIPERIANAPELKPGMNLYLEAFLDLDSERGHAFGPERIPLGKIFEYAIAYEFDEEQTEDLVYLVREMDKAHVSNLNRKEKSKQAISKGRKPRR